MFALWMNLLEMYEEVNILTAPTWGLIQAVKNEEKYQYANCLLYRNHQNNTTILVWSPLCIPNNM